MQPPLDQVQPNASDGNRLSAVKYSRRSALKAGLGGLVGFSLTGVSGVALSACRAGDQKSASWSAGSPEWSDLRSQFRLANGVSYLNNASIGLPPAVVADAVASGYRLLSEDPIYGKHELQNRISNIVLPTLARFFGAATEEITLTRNASIALHLQSLGLPLRAGDEVVITTQEHPAGRNPWLYRQARHGVAVKEIFIPSPLPSEDYVVAAFDQAIGPKTKAIAFCHVTRGGHLYPVKRLCSLARERGVASLVDGAQAVGQFGVDLQNLGCDAYSASLHKWMLAPAGTGFLYVNGNSPHGFLSMFAVTDSASNQFGLPGTADFPVRAAIGPALAFVEQLGIGSIEERCRFLSDYLKTRLTQRPEVTLFSGNTAQSAPGSTIFEIDGLDAIHAVEVLAQSGIHIDEHQRDGHNAIRISTHVYNTPQEIDAALDRLLAAS